MRNNMKLFHYPEEIHSLLLKTEDIIFEDGDHVTPEEIWTFVTTEGPRRFPFAYAKNLSFARQLSDDYSFMSGIRSNYLGLTAIDRIRNHVKKEKTLVLVQGGITPDLYYGAGCIPVGPMFLRGWIVNTREGRDFRNANLTGSALLEKARHSMTFECCNLISYLGLLKTEQLPISAVAPVLTSRCSDMAYAAEEYALSGGKLPTFMMDYPSNYDWGEWRIDYLKKEIKSMMTKLATISGTHITDASFLGEIKRMNKARRLARECQKISWDAQVPPVNSLDSSYAHLAMMGSFDFHAATQVLEETRDEMMKRVHEGIKGKGLADDPARIFICGSCAHANGYFIDRKGGVIVGNEDIWSSLSIDVKETGDPYENLATALSALPYEMPTEERAEWTIHQVNKSRADGIIFMYNWGCNYQSAVAGMMTDILKKETGLPVIAIEVGELTRMDSIEQSQNRIESFIEMIR